MLLTSCLGGCPPKCTPKARIARHIVSKRSAAWGISLPCHGGLLPLTPSICGSAISHAYGARRRSLRVVSAVQSPVQSPFRYERELDGVERALGGIPKPAQMAGALLGVLAAGAAGALAGGRLAPVDLRTLAKATGAVIAGAIAVFVVKKLDEKRASAAAAELWNLIVALGDPDELTRDMVEGVSTKYGLDLNQRCLEDVQRIYDAYLEAVIPPGDVPLKGNEAERIIAFKVALGLQDEEAAPSHLSVGQRIMRSRYESQTRNAEAEQRKTLQKLIYVSSLAFGDQKAAFLLPWARVFRFTEAQVYVAKRDNARALFKQRLDQLGGCLPGDREGLLALRAAQQQFKLGDEEAEAEVKLAARNQVEKFLGRAVECLKRRMRVRDYTDAITEVKALLDYNRRLMKYAGHEGMPPGLGRVSVYGGKFESGPQARDMRELYRVYIEEEVRRDEEFSEQLEDDLIDLTQLVALGSKEADALRDEVMSKIYRRMLREEVTSGRLAAAESKAQVLEGLCERLHFDAEAAASLHKSLYRQKLESLLEKKQLTDEDGAELDKLRVLLCIKKAEVAAIHMDVCGRIYKMAVEEAMDGGFQRFQPQDRERVRDVRKDVRLEAAQALQILDASARRRMLTYVTRARSQKNKLEGAKELKAMVFFSNIVVAPLLHDIKSAERKDKAQAVDKTGREIAELMKKAQEAAKAEEAAASGAVEEAAEEAAESTVDATETTIDVEANTVDEPAQPSRAEKKRVIEELLETPTESAERKHAVEELENAAVREDALLAAERREAEQILDEAVAKAREQEAKEGEVVAEVDAEVKQEPVKEEEEDKAPVKAQKDITLKNELELKDRLAIYQNYLLYCVSGEVLELPMGSSIMVERDASEFERLQELGDILGLSPMEVATVRGDLAEQGFRRQVEETLTDGYLTPEKVEKLNEIRDKIGLTKEMAEKVIKGVQSQNLRKTINAQDAMGTLNLKGILDLKESGIDVETLLSLDKRTDLYTKEVAAQLSKGTGDFDAERVLKSLPADLGLPESKVKQVVEGQARERKRTTLVQAISFLRQRKLDDATQAVNNLLACNRALPSDKAVEWGEKEEIQDLYSVYVGREHDAGKQTEVRNLLGLSEQESQRLQELVSAGAFRMEEEAEEEGAFF